MAFDPSFLHDYPSSDRMVLLVGDEAEVLILYHEPLGHIYFDAQTPLGLIVKDEWQGVADARAITITSCVNKMMLHSPRLLHSLLEEIPKVFPLLERLDIVFSFEIPRPGRLVTMIKKVLLTPFFGKEEPLGLDTYGVRTELYTMNAQNQKQKRFQVLLAGTRVCLRSKDKLLDGFFQLPNLQTVRTSGGGIVRQVCLIPDLKVLDYADVTKRVIHKEFSSLMAALTKPKRKRKRCSDINLAGRLQKLETLVFRELVLTPDFMAPFCQTMLENQTLQHIRIRGALHANAATNPFDPFLDILRHNHNLQSMDVDIDYSSFLGRIDTTTICLPSREAMQDEVESILLDHNHSISFIYLSISLWTDPGLRYLLTQGHPGIQNRLDLNFFKLTPYLVVSPNTTPARANASSFPLTLIAAVEKEKMKDTGRLVPCLYNLFLHDTQLLTNSLNL